MVWESQLNSYDFFSANKHVAPVQTDCHTSRTELCHCVKWVVPAEAKLASEFCPRLRVRLNLESKKFVQSPEGPCKVGNEGEPYRQENERPRIRRKGFVCFNRGVRKRTSRLLQGFSLIFFTSSDAHSLSYFKHTFSGKIYIVFGHFVIESTSVFIGPRRGLTGRGEGSKMRKKGADYREGCWKGNVGGKRS